MALLGILPFNKASEVKLKFVADLAAARGTENPQRPGAATAGSYVQTRTGNAPRGSPVKNASPWKFPRGISEELIATWSFSQVSTTYAKVGQTGRAFAPKLEL